MMMSVSHLIWIIPLSSLAGGFVWLVAVIGMLLKRGLVRKNEDGTGTKDDPKVS